MLLRHGQITRLLFPFCLCGLSFPCGDAIGHSRDCDQDLCLLPELPKSAAGTVNGSWMSIGCIGGAGGVCGVLVSAAFVPKDVHDRAIWTVAVVFHPVVTNIITVTHRNWFKPRL